MSEPKLLRSLYVNDDNDVNVESSSSKKTATSTVAVKMDNNYVPTADNDVSTKSYADNIMTQLDPTGEIAENDGIISYLNTHSTKRTYDIVEITSTAQKFLDDWNGKHIYFKGITTDNSIDNLNLIVNNGHETGYNCKLYNYSAMGKIFITHENGIILNGDEKVESIVIAPKQVATVVALSSGEFSISVCRSGTMSIEDTIDETDGISCKELKVGDIVKFNVNNIPTEFIVVHQGKPDDTNYGCSIEDSTWFLMKDIYTLSSKVAWINFDFCQSQEFSSLNNTFFYQLDKNLQQAIRTVRLPYVVKGSNRSFKTGAKTKIFLLSAKEYSCTSSYGKIGTVLDYFNNIDTSITIDRLEAPKYNGSSMGYWTRDVTSNSADLGTFVDFNDSLLFNTGAHSSYAYGLQPAFILSNSTRLIENNEGVYNVIVPTLPIKGKALNDYTWEEIRQISDAGQAEEYFQIGDKKEVILNGTNAWSGLTLTNYKTYAFIIGINHNSEYEGINRIHFQLGMSSLEDTGIPLLFGTGTYGSIPQANTDADGKGIRWNWVQSAPNQTNGQYSTYIDNWGISSLRNKFFGIYKSEPKDTILSFLPNSLLINLKSIKKYQDEDSSGSYTVSLASNTNYCFPLSEYEIGGKISSNCSSKQEYYTYYSKINTKKELNISTIQTENYNPYTNFIITRGDRYFQNSSTSSTYPGRYFVYVKAGVIEEHKAWNYDSNTWSNIIKNWPITVCFCI